MTIVISIGEESDDRSVSVFTTWGGERGGEGEGQLSTDTSLSDLV